MSKGNGRRRMLGASTPSWTYSFGGYGNDNRRARRQARARESHILQRQIIGDES